MDEASTVAELGRRLGEVPPPEVPQHPYVAAWRAPTEDDIDAVHALMAAADTVDHPTWITPRDEVADTFDLPHIDHRRDSIIGVDAGGRVVALGSAFLHPSRAGALTVTLGGCVHPEVRGRGIGTAVLAWQRARGRQHIAEVLPSLDGTTAWTADLKVYAEESNAPHRRIAEAAGMVPER
ncbi:GNAT family N-acetyltransferase [Microbacterium telephonicum]|uniref:GNAT family N-acetyltransferase n=1 Tax=Microbacterium telephonicum TaxID=1714841 RepID=UPI001F543320|nr:GNAT family N-acetyltransferase [Microbacterium telephonicum]